MERFRGLYTSKLEESSFDSIDVVWTGELFYDLLRDGENEDLLVEPHAQNLDKHCLEVFQSCSGVYLTSPTYYLRRGELEGHLMADDPGPDSLRLSPNKTGLLCAKIARGKGHGRMMATKTSHGDQRVGRMRLEHFV